MRSGFAALGEFISVPDPIDIAVGARLRLRRQSLDLSQTNLADALGITFQQVQKYERGTNRVSASMLVRAAHALETTVAALVGEDGEAPIDHQTLARLATPGAARLLAAYAEIKGDEHRAALLTAASALVKRHPEAARRRAAS